MIGPAFARLFDGFICVLHRAEAMMVFLRRSLKYLAHVKVTGARKLKVGWWGGLLMSYRGKSPPKVTIQYNMSEGLCQNLVMERYVRVTFKCLLSAVFSAPSSTLDLQSRQSLKIPIQRVSVPLWITIYVLRLCVGLLRMPIHFPERPFANPILLVHYKKINVALSHVITTIHLDNGWNRCCCHCYWQ